uniref:Uncharacterized protein n=1 Tax=Rousettus aegyptiacus TaxID=9407 RepID=A0A7J8FK70_ROUAE|nr:hypothetical protein HJG63_011976 [Rousettus aegyptiacus]
MVTKFPSNKRPCVCCLCHQGPCSQALTLMKAPPTTTHSALRAGQTIREVDTGHRARQKQVPLLPLEIEAPWPNRMNFSSLLSHFPRSFWTAWICVLKTWYLSVLYLQPTLNINQVNWEGELFIKHAHSNFID